MTPGIAGVWQAELRHRVAILTYTRPAMNVLGFADLAEPDETLQRWGGDERARVVVLTGGIPAISPRTRIWLRSEAS